MTKGKGEPMRHKRPKPREPKSKPQRDEHPRAGLQRLLERTKPPKK
jgi:hypothetical protein